MTSQTARNLFVALFAMLIAPGYGSAQNVVLILSDDQGWTGLSVQMDDRVVLLRSFVLARPGPACSRTAESLFGRRAVMHELSRPLCFTRSTSLPVVREKLLRA